MTSRHGVLVFSIGLLAPALPAQVWTRITTAAAPPARRFHTLAYDAARGRTVLFGGYDNSALLGDTWEFDGTSWQNTSPASSPPARRYHTMCWDRSRGRTVLFGGADNVNILTDTWEYDGTTWAQVATTGTPSTRYGMTIEYDAARRRTVLFGGDGPTGAPLNDTWEYDGLNWSQVALPAAPPRRSRTALAYDSARGAVVLSGGFDGLATSGNVTGIQLGDSWRFDGLTWAPIGAGPAARSLHSSVYDVIRGRTVLFGGMGNVIQGGHGGGNFTPLYNDVWLCDGTTWTQAPTPLLAPSARYAAAMAFDLARGCVVLNGGGDQFTLPGDTWEWRPAPAPTWTRHGPGCAGSGPGTPALDAAPGARPALGSPFLLQATALPPQPGLTLLLLGFDLAQWAGVPLPLGVDPSRPGCLLWIGLARGFSMPVPHGGSTSASIVLNLPADPSLAGLVLGMQGLALDPQTPAGFALTNGGIAQLR